jgi:hypothetical protein
MLDNWGNNMTDEVVKKKLYGLIYQNEALPH